MGSHNEIPVRSKKSIFSKNNQLQLNRNKHDDTNKVEVKPSPDETSLEKSKQSSGVSILDRNTPNKNGWSKSSHPNPKNVTKKLQFPGKLEDSKNDPDHSPG